MTTAQKVTVGQIQREHVGCPSETRKEAHGRVRLHIHTRSSTKSYEITPTGRSYQIA